MDNFFNHNYSEIVLMARKICRGSDESEDVAHFAISEFMQHERCQELIDAGRGMNFLSGIIHRSFHSSTSQYHTIYRQKGRMHELYVTHDNLQDSDQYDMELDHTVEGIQGILEDMKADTIELWFRATLFEMWVHTPNFSELARKTCIPRTSISKAVEEAREYIRQQLTNNNIQL